MRSEARYLHLDAGRGGHKRRQLTGNDHFDCGPDVEEDEDRNPETGRNLQVKDGVDLGDLVDMGAVGVGGGFVVVVVVVDAGVVAADVGSGQGEVDRTAVLHCRRSGEAVVNENRYVDVGLEDKRIPT